MKPAIVTASFALAIPTITGCAVSSENPPEPWEQGNAKEMDRVDEGTSKQDMQAP